MSSWKNWEKNNGKHHGKNYSRQDRQDGITDLAHAIARKHHEQQSVAMLGPLLAQAGFGGSPVNGMMPTVQTAAQVPQMMAPVAQPTQFPMMQSGLGMQSLVPNPFPFQAQGMGGSTSVPSFSSGGLVPQGGMPIFQGQGLGNPACHMGWGHQPMQPQQERMPAPSENNATTLSSTISMLTGAVQKLTAHFTGSSESVPQAPPVPTAAAPEADPASALKGEPMDLIHDLLQMVQASRQKETASATRRAKPKAAAAKKGTVSQEQLMQVLKLLQPEPPTAPVAPETSSGGAEPVGAPPVAEAAATDAAPPSSTDDAMKAALLEGIRKALAGTASSEGPPAKRAKK